MATGGEAIRAQALALGFDAVGFAPATLATQARDRLRTFLVEGRHGDMGWLADTADRRGDPHALWPEAKSIVVLGQNYGTDEDAFANLTRRERATISLYARRRDYHDVVKKRLKALARWIVDRHGTAVKVFVDTAPILEKTVAAQSRLGWQGKHTNLVSREFGSWLFLGEIFTTLDLPVDPPEADHCGTCRRCLDVCPTAAFPAPYQLDAQRCISYLTIEHKGHIAREFRRPLGNRIYGCDDCLAVCPWNRFARASADAALALRAELSAPALADLARLDDTAFRALFAGTPVKRLGRDRFVRNVLIAIGNSRASNLAAQAEALLADLSPLVRAMAVWALGELLSESEFAALKARQLPGEIDPDVRAEWLGS
ncbi:MAG: tRNA epoxyqueuosine(34) reductase QueG [Alphaproteobacteria bacterium]|nr:tRNA epoxyqueuosine(34) reductase QueG [Alphaproteobacteria bacterium]